MAMSTRNDDSFRPLPPLTGTRGGRFGSAARRSAEPVRRPPAGAAEAGRPLTPRSTMDCGNDRRCQLQVGCPQWTDLHRILLEFKLLRPGCGRMPVWAGVPRTPAGRERAGRATACGRPAFGACPTAGGPGSRASRNGWLSFIPTLNYLKGRGVGPCSSSSCHGPCPWPSQQRTEQFVYSFKIHP